MDAEITNGAKAPEDLGRPREGHTLAGHGAPPRILIVDDEPVIRQINTRMLTRAGYAVDATEDGAAAWEALHSTCYDLLITDNNMPKVSGIELLKMVRAAGLALPVIMATGLLPEHEFARHPWLQPAALLLKPYTTDELLQKVQDILPAPDGPCEPGTSPPEPA